jgi:hypothetical protein
MVPGTPLTGNRGPLLVVTRLVMLLAAVVLRTRLPVAHLLEACDNRGRSPDEAQEAAPGRD